MEQFYRSALVLLKGAQEITDELAKYNLGIWNNNKKSLATLAGMARELANKYKQLRINLIKKHEKEQKNGTNPDG